MAKKKGTGKVALVTGASSGIGYEVALQLKDQDFIVYGAARRVDKMKDLVSKGIQTLSLDVTDEASVQTCVDTILKREGKIDILINNAGYGSYGAVEDVPIKEAQSQLDVNLFGLVRMTQAVLPSMRKNHYGRIINSSSVAGKVHTPFGAWYHASKFAVEGLSDCLRMETAEFGIDVVLIEPGGIRTNWGLIAADKLEETGSHGAYAQQTKETSAVMRKRYSNKGLTEPDVVAREYVKASIAKKPKTRYLKGSFSHSLVFLRRILTDRMYDKIMRKFG